MTDYNFDDVILSALAEDIPQGDITSESVVPADSRSKAVIMAKEEGILAGIPVAQRVFELIDPSVSFRVLKRDGRFVQIGDLLAEIEGPSISLLKGERTALNFLQRMSGIATTTRKFVQILSGSGTKVLDTRKTTPGMRVLEKYAVKMGGGENHRSSLSDMVLLKDNHLHIVGSVSAAVRLAKEKVPSHIKVEVETTNMDEVKEAIESGADIIMLDNMPIEEMREAIQWVNGRVPLEVSGNVTLQNAAGLKDLGVDFISIGGLTHSYQSLDISLEFL